MNLINKIFKLTDFYHELFFVLKIIVILKLILFIYRY